MAVHKWRRRDTKYFGQVWTPFAEIGIKASSGTFMPFAMQADSGAVISLLRRSAVDVLGIELQSGRKVELSAVGHGTTVAYVHGLVTRFDDGICYPVRYAISESESSPNLLGRLDVFDRLQVDFDATLDETRISAPWLDPGDRRIWEFLLDTERRILSRWAELGLPAPADTVAKQFINRGEVLLACAMGLVKLHRPHAGPLFIRTLFELAMQFEYLMQDPAERAQRYLDFAHITRHRQSQEITKNPLGPISDWIASSPQRAAGEQRNLSEYNRVLPHFEKRPGRPWDKWFCMSVRDLADKLNWLGEYRVWYAMCCNFAHADPFSTESEVPFPTRASRITMVACFHYYARMLLRISDKIILTSEQYDGLTKLAQPMQ
jgi:hypothetical protein